MSSFNKVMLMGNLTRDPELKNTASGATVSSLGLAVNRKYKQGDEWKEEVCFSRYYYMGQSGGELLKVFKQGKPCIC